MTKELVLGILISTVGTKGVVILSIHGGKVLVKRASLNVIQQIIAFFGGKIAQKILKSMVAKWVPIIGAGAIAIWGKSSTVKLGHHAVSILEQDIEIVDEEIKHVDIDDDDENSTTASVITAIDYERAKLKTLVNIVKIDKKIHEEEQKIIQELIEKSTLSIDEKIELANSLSSDRMYDAPYTIFKSSPERVIDLVMDMMTLTKVNGEIALSERIYLKNAFKELGLDEQDVASLFQS